jgi:hypothetical protein
MNDNYAQIMLITLLGIFFGMLATVLLPATYAAIGLIITVIALILAIALR